MKRTPILPLLTLVLALFVAITQSTAQTTNKVTVSAYSVEPTALNEFIANKDNDGNYNLVDPKPVLRVVFQGCDLVRYDNEELDVFRGENGGIAGVITEDWFDEKVTYPYWVKLGLHENCYITYGSKDENRVSLAIDDPEFIEKDDDSGSEQKIIFKFITSDLEYIPSNTEFKLHLPKFSFVDETSDEIVSVKYGNSFSDPDEDDEIIFVFKTKECNVVSESKELYNYDSEVAKSTPLIVCDKSDYIIDNSDRKCSQLIVEPGSGIRIRNGSTLTVVDTAYFIGPDTYDLTLRPYLINYGTFDNSTKENDEEVGRTVFTHTVAMTENDNIWRKMRVALPIEKCLGLSLSTYFDEKVGFAFVKEQLYDGTGNYGQTILRSHSASSYTDEVFTYEDLNLYCRPGFSNTWNLYNREAILRLNGKINDNNKYSFENESKYKYSSDEYNLVDSRFSANNVFQAPLDMRRIYEDKKTDALSMWVSYGKNNNYFVYNCISGITTFDGDMREGYLLPQMSYFFADHNSNYDLGDGSFKSTLSFEYDKDDLKTYDDIIESKSYTKSNNTNEIDVDYKYIRFYAQETSEESSDFGNRCVFAVYFVPKEKYDRDVSPYRYGSAYSGSIYDGSNVTDGHMNPEYECMVECDAFSTSATVEGEKYSSYQPNFYHFPVLTASSYNGYDVDGIYYAENTDNFEKGYYDYQRGLLIKCLPEPVPCNVGSTEEPHNHSKTIKETVVVTDDDGEPVIDDEGNQITEEVDTGVKECSYQALDLPLIIRCGTSVTASESEVELGILDTNITNEDGITLADADGTNVISEKLLAGETYTVKFDEKRTQIFLNHAGLTVPYTILKLKVVPYPEYSSEYVMPDDPEDTDTSTESGTTGDNEDLDDDTSGQDLNSGDDDDSGTGDDSGSGGDSGSGSGETTPTTPGAVSTIQTSTVSVVAKQSAVEVRGTQPGAVCAIYDLTGAQVAQKTSAGSTVTLQVPKAGIYFIAIAQENTTKTFKTIVK